MASPRFRRLGLEGSFGKAASPLSMSWRVTMRTAYFSSLVFVLLSSASFTVNAGPAKTEV